MATVGAATRLMLLILAACVTHGAGARRPAVPPALAAELSTAAQSSADSALQRSSATAPARRSLLLVLAGAAAAVSAQEELETEGWRAQAQRMQQARLEWQKQVGPDVPEQVSLSLHQMAKLIALPSDAPMVPKFRMRRLRHNRQLQSRFGRGWPFDWIWSPEVFLKMRGALSRYSGAYALYDLEQGSDPVWVRTGEGRTAVVRYFYDDGVEEWRYKAEVFEGADNNQTADVHGANCGPTDAEPLHGGHVDFEFPRWNFEAEMWRRQAGDEGLGEAVYEGSLGLQEHRHEGMPVYMSVPSDLTGISWLFSQDGRWYFAQSAKGDSFEDLIERGFFKLQGVYAERWMYRSEPHEGCGPEVAWEAGSDGLLPEFSSMAAPSAASLLERPAAEAAGRAVLAQAAYECAGP